MGIDGMGVSPVCLAQHRHFLGIDSSCLSMLMANHTGDNPRIIFFTAQNYTFSNLKVLGMVRIRKCELKVTFTRPLQT